ncbi:hypothetical protein CNMCM6805_006190 [Aspergillus fumigatiaffinis]|uniref:Uncharacterized protein n=1 Tax=Aspergillus fumigatiaffinis TaxID=340414 RepID=A0A8H4MCL2_9EURO|nr:hypothetical protein CNMCM6805_006190 [Aspergillus fumigatiaffinis]
MDSYFMRCHEVKKAEVEKDLDGHVRYVDNAVTRHACFEVYEEHAKYLVQRYPKIFLLEGNPNAGCATSFLVRDDLVLVIENEDSSVERRTVHHTTELDGQYHLDAAAVCPPGLAISGEIQRVTGHAAFRDWRVPHYVAKLQKSMNRFLKVLTPERAVEQNNIFIQLDDSLH